MVLGALLAITTCAFPTWAAAAGAEVHPAPTGSGASSPAETGAALRVVRAELLTRIARLTDEAEGAQARLVAARQREAVAGAGAAHAGRALAEHAIEAFVHNGSLRAAAGLRGGLFAEVVAGVDRAVVDDVAAAATTAAAGRVAAEAAHVEAGRAAAEVADARQALESTIEVADRRAADARAEDDRSALARRVAEAERARQEAERARQEAALAQREAALAQQEEAALEETAREETAREEAGRLAGEAAGAGSSPGVTEAAAAGALPGADPQPGEPGGTDGSAAAPAAAAGDAGRSRDRVGRASAAEADLLARHRFGPVTDVPPGASRTGQVVEGMASWYGPGFDGRPTASGAVFDQQGWTVASKELPLGTVLLVTRGSRSVLVLVNDRGPFVSGRVLDLSRAVASELGTIEAGVAHVRAEVVRLP